MAIRVVCTVQVPHGACPECARIVEVGVSGGDFVVEERYSVPEVVRQLDAGVSFYTVGPYTGKVAYLERYWCMKCAQYHIRTKADSTTDNNLDSLAYCPMKKAS